MTWRFRVTAIRRFPDYRSELAEQQPENDLALAQGPTQTLGVVMEDGAAGAAFEATALVANRRCRKDRNCRVHARSACAGNPSLSERCVQMRSIEGEI